jgi:hypothetical protein
LAKVENTAENLLTALTGISIKAGKAIERVSILIRQLEKIFLFLMIVKEKKAVIVLRVGYIICRLMTPRV